jgi:hypothetical protein
MTSPIAELLLAEAPDASGLELFGRFVGSWAFAGKEIEADGTERRTRGRWDFGYILGGRAIQDVLRYDRGDYGTTLRLPRQDGTWEVIWISIWHRAVRLTAWPEGERIVASGGDGEREVRWRFDHIAAGSFIWRGEERISEDAPFRLAEEITLQRV